MVVLSAEGGVIMDIKEQTKNMTSEDKKNLAKEIIEKCVSTESPIEDSPHIHVVFCKGRNGWLPFTGYGCDISPKKTVEFINRINDAADVLNEKEE